MEIRIVRESDIFIVQRKIRILGILWKKWQTFKEMDCDWGDCHYFDRQHKTEELALKWIIDYEKKKVDNQAMKDREGIVMEIDTKELREKFSEYFI